MESASDSIYYSAIFVASAAATVLVASLAVSHASLSISDISNLLNRSVNRFQAGFAQFLAAAEEHLPGGAGDAPGRRMGRLFTQIAHSLQNNLNEISAAARAGRDILPVNLANALYSIPSQASRLSSATLDYSRRAGGHLYTGAQHVLTQAATFANYSYAQAEPVLTNLSGVARAQMREARQWVINHPFEVATVASAVVVQRMIDEG